MYGGMGLYVLYTSDTDWTRYSSQVENLLLLLESRMTLSIRVQALLNVSLHFLGIMCPRNSRSTSES